MESRMFEVQAEGPPEDASLERLPLLPTHPRAERGQPKSSRPLWVLTLKPDRDLFSGRQWSWVLLFARAVLPCPAPTGELTQPVGLLWLCMLGCWAVHPHPVRLY